MARFYVDCELNDYQGDPFSMAIVKQDGTSIYLIDKDKINELSTQCQLSPWVAENVLPVINRQPGEPIYLPFKFWHAPVTEFLFGDKSGIPQIFADWPADISILCDALISGPGMMGDSVAQMHFTMLRVNAYPTTLPDCVQHNAWWDAMALRRWLLDNEKTS